MRTLKNPIVGLILFAILVGLSITIYEGFEEKYDVERQVESLIEGKNIMDQLKDINIFTSINKTSSAAYKVVNPTKFEDIFGGLLGVGLGLLKTATAVITFPGEIIYIIGQYYRIPEFITSGLMIIISVFILFIMIRAIMKSDV